MNVTTVPEAIGDIQQTQGAPQNNAMLLKGISIENNSLILSP